jgi:hypothetical protein
MSLLVAVPQRSGEVGQLSIHVGGAALYLTQHEATTYRLCHGYPVYAAFHWSMPNRPTAQHILKAREARACYGSRQAVLVELCVHVELHVHMR